MKIAIPMKGRMMHSVDGKLTFQPYSKDGKSAIYSGIFTIDFVFPLTLFSISW